MRLSKTDLEPGILAIDAGSGTQDILLWMPGLSPENCPRMILPSATVTLAARIEEATKQGRAIFLSGKTMGGGACAAALRRHLQAGFDVFARKQPALTLHDNIDRVRRMGVRIVEARPTVDGLAELEMMDVDLAAISRAFSLFRLPLPRRAAIAVQDHGYSPRRSNRAFRFEQWTALLRSGKGLETLLYDRPPHHLTRMRAVCETVPGAWVMDTGAAAILGALLDDWVASRKGEGVTLINAGNEHTLAALFKDDTLWGVYEHHSSLLDSVKLAAQLDRFRKEDLTNADVFDDMGHGCHVLPGAKRVSSFEHLALTGPGRRKFLDLGGHLAAPYGDMMLSGCFGLVEAVKRRTGTQASKV